MRRSTETPLTMRLLLCLPVVVDSLMNMRSLEAHLSSKCGVEMSSKVEIKNDSFGGRGLFAKADVACEEILARIPWSSVVAAQDKLEVAALILRARHGDGDEAHCAYAETIDWESLKGHPLMDEHKDAVAQEMHEKTKWAATQVQETTGFPFSDCLDAVLVLLTRAFDLSHLRPDAPAALVPLFDYVNHPSASVVTPAFVKVPISGAVVGTTLDNDDGFLCLRAPRQLDVRAGDQLFHWYGNAGIGEEDPVIFHQRERKFILQYGFSPWE